MPRILEKVERRLGEKLFLKGDRCVGPKCAMVRRAYPPGIHGKKRGGRGRGRGRDGSEFGTLLGEKQKVRFFYGLDDTHIKRYVGEASRQTGIFGDNLIRALERRLDTIVWRLGFTPSRRGARQAIVHGHITINGRIIAAPSYMVKTGDAICIAERARRGGVFQSLADRLRPVQPPSHLSLDKERACGTLVKTPEAGELGLTFDIAKVKEFYSR